MSDLRIKPNFANGDLSKQKDLFTDEELLSPLAEIIDDGDNEMNWEKESYNPSLMDIFNPALLRQKFENINGHTNKDKDKQ